jgi:hypothetical protein
MAKTFERENQFQFVCPVFQATTKIASCLVLRDAVWRGEKVEQRQGCQCAMRSGKCPVPTIVTQMVRLKSDPYHSAEPTVGKLSYDILDGIAPVLVTDTMMGRFMLSAQEEKLLRQGNEDARSGKRVIQKKPRRQERVVEMEDVKETEQEPASTDASELMRAAQSGDMSAAINSAAAGE